MERTPSNQIVWRANPCWQGMVPWYIKGFLVAGAITAVAYLAQTQGALSMFWVVVIGLVSAGFVMGVGHLIRHSTTYTITGSTVMESSGILNTKKEQARIEKITNITVTRTLGERILGIGKVNIDTANDREDILDWWGVKDPHGVERKLDDLRLEAEEES